MATPGTTQIRQFVVHKSASKHRIFAVQNWSDQLKAVTSLDPSADEMMADRLATALNEALASSDLDSFKPILDQLSEPVRLSVKVRAWVLLSGCEPY